MPAKRGAKSSKTAHVLNLISSSPEAEQEQATSTATDENPPAPATETAPSPAPAPAKPTVPALEVAKVSNEALSDSISDALGQALEQDIISQNQTPSVIPPTKSPADSAHFSGGISAPWREDLAPQTAPMSAPPSRPVAIEEAARVTSARVGNQNPDNDIEFVNVMEVLVDDVLERYIKLLGVCPCSRCAADTKALTLCRLPAKYVVLDPENRPTVLSFYASKFETDIKSQIMVACQAIKNSPRHSL